MLTLLLWLLAPIAALLIAYPIASQFPRFCGYLLGPIFLLSAVIFFVIYYDYVFGSTGQSDAWGPGNLVPLIVGYGGVVWCIFGIVFLTRGLAGVRRLDETMPASPHALGNTSQTSQPEGFFVPGSKRIAPKKMLLVAVAIYVVACVSFVLVNHLVAA